MDRIFHAKTLAEALLFRKEQGAIVMAGGTDLMVRKRGWAGTIPDWGQPVLLIGDVAELQGIETESGFEPESDPLPRTSASGRDAYLESGAATLRIGAATTLSALLASPAVPAIFKEALAQMAAPAIRNMATLGGNICNASPAGDTLPFLYASDASVILQSPDRQRQVPIADFIQGPGRTALAADELLTAVRIPNPRTAFSHITYRKVGTRKANALAKLSFIGLARISDGRCADIRLAFGAVAPQVVRDRDLESAMQNQWVADIAQASLFWTSRYAGLVRPIDDQRSTAAYRKTVALRLLNDYLCSLNTP